MMLPYKWPTLVALAIAGQHASGCTQSDEIDRGGPFLDISYPEHVSAYEPGPGAMPAEMNGISDIVRGAPDGNAVMLGCGGSIIVDLSVLEARAEGPEIVIFGPGRDPSGSEGVGLGDVSVSVDGQDWLAFPCDLSTGVGCVGSSAANLDELPDPEDLGRSGGESFDLDVLEEFEETTRYLRVRDRAVNTEAVECTGLGAGFALDSIGLVHLVERG